MKRFTVLIAGAAALVAVSGCAAQQAPARRAPAPPVTIQFDDSLQIKASPELQKSLEDLAAAVEALAQRVANDPKLRATAMHVASNLVATAQQVMTEQSGAIQEALRTAAERIAAAQAAQKAQTKKP